MKAVFAAAIFVCAVALSPFACAQSSSTRPIVKEGRTVKISPHVHVIPDELVSLVPNVGIVVGSKLTMIIDPGLGLASGQAVAKEVAKVSGQNELMIVNTHFHPEHTTGDAAFPNAKIVRSAAVQQDIDEMGMKWVGIFAGRSPELAEILKGATFRKPDEVFEKEKTVDLGGVRVKMVWLGPGHTRGDTVFFVEGDNVLFSGDLAMKNLFPAFATPQSSVRSWLAALAEFERMRPVRVIGAHGEMGDASVIAAYREYLTALQARATALKREGRTEGDAAKQLTQEFSARYPQWQQAARIAPAVAIVYKEAQ
jgi:cyclase